MDLGGGLVTKSCLTLCGSYRPSPARLPCQWDSPGKNTGLGCHFLLQGIVPSQQSNSGLLHCRRLPALQPDSLPIEPPGKPSYVP